MTHVWMVGYTGATGERVPVYQMGFTTDYYRAKEVAREMNAKLPPVQRAYVNYAPMKIFDMGEKGEPIE